MNQQKRSNYAYGTTSAPRKKIAVTYAIRDELEKLNRSGVNKLLLVNEAEKKRTLYSAGRDSIIRCWDVSNNENIGEESYSMSLEHHTDWVNDIVLCSNKITLMSASSDTTVKVWDLSRGMCTSTLRTHKDYVRCLGYAPGTEAVVSAGLDCSIYLWDVNTLTSLTASNNTVTTMPLRGQKQSIYSVAISENGNIVVSGSTEKALRVWDTRTQTKVMKLKGHTDNVRAVVVNSDGTQCLSASSDGTVRLWSLAQQRCLQTFRDHSEGVWCLAVDKSFSGFYSGGKDKRVFYNDISECELEGVPILTEEAPILSLSLDDSSADQPSLWVSTTATCINKWPVNTDREREEEEELKDECVSQNEMKNEEEPAVTDIDDYESSIRPLATIPGGSCILECGVVSNKRQVLTKDSDSMVTLWDILHACKKEELGNVDLEEELERRKEALFVPNWFSCDIRTGMLAVRLEEVDCFSTWVMGNNTDLPGSTADIKLNYGALMLKALFEYWPNSETMKAKQRILDEQKLQEQEPLTEEQFLESLDKLQEWWEIGQALDVPQSQLEKIREEHSNDDYHKCKLEIFKYLAQGNAGITIGALVQAVQKIGKDELEYEIRQLADKSSKDSDEKNSNVGIKFFSVPLHTPVVLSEATDNGSSLVRFICGDAGNFHDSHHIEAHCPVWITDVVCENILPVHPKMSFTLVDHSCLQKPDAKVDRLSAQDILTVKKIIDYQIAKSSGDKSSDKSQQLEIICQDQVLDLMLDVRTVRYTIWKSGGDMKFSYRVKTTPTPPSPTESQDPDDTATDHTPKTMDTN